MPLAPGGPGGVAQDGNRGRAVGSGSSHHAAAASCTQRLSYLAHTPGRRRPAPGNEGKQGCCLQCPLKYKGYVAWGPVAVWPWAGSRIPLCLCSLIPKAGLTIESVAWG